MREELQQAVERVNQELVASEDIASAEKALDVMDFTIEELSPLPLALLQGDPYITIRD